MATWAHVEVNAHHAEVLAHGIAERARAARHLWPGQYAGADEALREVIQKLHKAEGFLTDSGHARRRSAGIRRDRFGRFI
jgi:hypothetical protein